MHHTFPDQNVLGLTITPSRAVSYKVPAHWIISGRTTKSNKPRINPPTTEEKQRRNRARVIGRYWQAVGWLWIRSRNRDVSYGEGKRMKFRQGFLTLTLPGVATADHKAIKNKVLDPFFTYCRNRMGLSDYVWTAELQDRGEIHFHAIINTFMDKDRVRAAWIRACENSGIVTMSSAGNKPATEIEKCKSYNGSKSYAAKYLGKALRSGEIIGRIWSGSHGVTGPSAISTNEIDAGFSIDKALAEINGNGHEWQGFDHEVKITRLEAQRITRRRYPYVWRLLMAQLRTYDQAGTRDLHAARKVGDRRPVAAVGRVASDRAVPHQAPTNSLSRHRRGPHSKPGIMLQAQGMGAAARPVGDVFAYVQDRDAWRVGYSPPGWN